MYLKGDDNGESKANKSAFNETRLTKFTLFDGVNKFQAMEYELLQMVHDFRSNPLVLALKPPIAVRKGMLLMRKTNCTVLL